MARKKSSGASPAKTKASKVIAKRRKQPRANPAPSRASRANPPVVSDLTHVVLPAFGAYALTRVFSRIVFSMVQKRWPKFGKHAHAASGVAAFIGAWFLAHRWSRLAKYHDGVIVGTGIAAAQGVAQTYLPAKYNWLLADPKAADVAAAAPAPQQQLLEPTGAYEETGAGDEYDVFEAQLDAIESPRGRNRTVAPPKATRTPVASAMRAAAHNDDDDTSAFDIDLVGELGADEDVDDLYSGAFEN